MTTRNKLKLFLSCVSSEFGSYRKTIQAAFQSDFTIRIQEDFKGKNHSLLETLDDYIRECDGLIHLVGDSTGLKAGNEEQKIVLRKHSPYISRVFPDLRKLANKNAFSYTQWEAYLACSHQIPRLVFRAESSAERMNHFTRDPNQQAEQKSHLARLKTSKILDRGAFKNVDDLIKQLTPRLHALRAEAYGKQMHWFPGLREDTRPNRNKCIGRTDQIHAIDKLFHESQPSIILLNGPRGIGKTSIIREWIQLLNHEGELKKTRFIFAYSFRDPTNTSTRSMDFFQRAKTYYDGIGYELPDNPNKLGDELAIQFMKAGGLMVLDGIDALQQPPGSTGRAKILDEELRNFLDALYERPFHRGRSKWKLVLTSQWPLPYQVNRRYRSLQVPPLTPDDAANVLKTFRLTSGNAVRRLKTQVSPNDRKTSAQKVFRDAAIAVGCQPLALVLLASYLINKHNGSLRVRNIQGKPQIDYFEFHTPSIEILQDQAHAEEHNLRIVDAWIDLLEAKKTGPKEQENRFLPMLRVAEAMSLFDAASSIEEINCVRKSNLKELKRHFKPIDSDNIFARAIDDLVFNRLIMRLNDGRLDFEHGLLRHQFSERFNQRFPKIWSLGHEQLFAVYLNGAKTASRQNYDFVRMLMESTSHGCRSGVRIREAFEEGLRGTREDQNGRASWSRVSSRSDDLVVLSYFFLPGNSPWSQVRFGLQKEEEAYVLNETGYALQKLCRFSESVKVFQKASKIWEDFCRSGVAKERLAEYRRLAIRDLVLLAKSSVASLDIALGHSAASKANNYARQIILDYPNTFKGLPSDDALRCIDAFSAFGWLSHLRNETTKAEEAFKLRNRLEDYKAATESKDPTVGCPRIKTQKLFQYASYLIDRKRFSTAKKVIKDSDLAAHQFASLAVNNLERNDRIKSLETDLAFNKVLWGRYYAGLYATRRKQLHFDRAEQELNAARSSCWQLDLLDGWLQAELAMADLLLSAKKLFKAKPHLLAAERLADTVCAERFSLECTILHSRFMEEQARQAKHPARKAILLNRSREKLAEAISITKKTGYKWRLDQLQ